MPRTAVFALLIVLSAAPMAAGATADPSNYTTVIAALNPGDTVTLASGTYTQDLNLNNLNGSPGAWITIRGPLNGSAVFPAHISSNTVEIRNCSYLAIENLTLDGQHMDGPFGVSANGGTGNLTHDIRVENCLITDYDGGQQTDGISTKCPTWGWIVRRNRIINVGTGVYFGNSDGSCPFIGGLFEGNLVQDSIGYCMQIKHQNTRPTVAGMPTGISTTIIRDNVFIKADRPSPDGDRPNLLVDGFPDSGAGADDLYQIYGNVFCHNPRESLFQGSGRMTIHDNLFIDVVGTAISLVDHNLPLKLAHVYNNTVYSAGRGIWFSSAARQADAVVGNLVFAGTAIGGAITTNRDNLVDAIADAGAYIAAPSLAFGTMDFYPRSGQCVGSAIDGSAFAGDLDATVDFNRTAKGTWTYRGAYAGSGTNPGWRLTIATKPIGSGGGTTTGGTSTSGSTTSSGTTSGTTGGTTVGSPSDDPGGRHGGTRCGIGSGLGLLLACGLYCARISRRRA